MVDFFEQSTQKKKNPYPGTLLKSYISKYRFHQIEETKLILWLRNSLKARDILLSKWSKCCDHDARAIRQLASYLIKWIEISKFLHLCRNYIQERVSKLGLSFVPKEPLSTNNRFFVNSLRKDAVSYGFTTTEISNFLDI
mgnify:CR=1 FL=1